MILAVIIQKYPGVNGEIFFDQFVHYVTIKTLANKVLNQSFCLLLLKCNLMEMLSTFRAPQKIQDFNNFRDYMAVFPTLLQICQFKILTQKNTVEN